MIDHIYSESVIHLLLPLAQVYLNNGLYTGFKELQRSQTFSIEELNRIQASGLKAIIKHAYSSVPMYREAFKQMNITPYDIKSADDLSLLPIITKDTFRSNFPDSCTSKLISPSEWHMNSTSGSTGTPFEFIKDKRMEGRTISNYFRNIIWAGINPGDKYVKLWGSHEEGRGKNTFTRYGMRRLELPCFDLDNKANHYYDIIRRYKPKAIEAYTSALVKFSKMILEDGIKDVRMPSAIVSAETLYEKDRKTIEEALGCQVYNRYGSREFGNIAQECSVHNGLHINSETFLIEIVDPATGEPCDYGESGKILITSFENYAMPFIRYEIGDMGTLTNENCSCGINLPLLKSVEGRVTDFISTDSRKMVPCLYFNYFFEQYGRFIKDFQVVQTSSNKIALKLVPTVNYNKDIEQTIHNKLFNYLGLDSLDIMLVERIELTKAGKKRTVIGLK